VKVVVSLGTDHHPFPRLLEWTTSWPCPAGTEVLAQTGETPAVDGLDCRPYLPPADLSAAMAGADAVVCHGGPGTIMQARHAGRLPIVVPRRPDLGEHVDGHQLRFASWMAERDQIVVADTDAELHAALDKALADPESFWLPGGGGAAVEASARFGKLVDELVRYRPR
jgi:UDP-N-acetylglucosamine transferase subunit ALG13